MMPAFPKIHVYKYTPTNSKQTSKFKKGKKTRNFLYNKFVQKKNK